MLPFPDAMDVRRSSCLGALLSAILLSTLLPIPSSTAAHTHVVGGSMWFIPPSSNFYSTWSRNTTFVVGDTLVFKFETGFYNVVQVSKREHDDCQAQNAFRTIMEGPATVALDEEGVRYYICTFGNYCTLGMKLSVSVNPPVL